MRALTITAFVLVNGACATAVPRPDDSSSLRPVTAQWVELSGSRFRFQLSDPAHVRIYYVTPDSPGYTGEVRPVADGRFARGVSTITRAHNAVPHGGAAFAGTYLLIASRAPFAGEKPSAPTVERILAAVLPEQDESGWDADMMVVPREVAATQRSWIAEEARRAICAERRGSRTAPTIDPMCSLP